MNDENEIKNDNNIEIIARIPEQPVGWLETKLPTFVMSKLWSYIETAKKNPINWNKELAGNISKSLTLEDKDDWFFETILVPHIIKFMKEFPTFSGKINILTEHSPFSLQTIWVNFQKENEFNPLHDHTGIWSFVIWMNIPTDWREQHALPISANSNAPKASNFEFQYTSMLGDVTTYRYFLDKTLEGGMIFFPAKLKHMVYPFYECEEERVTISGNILFDISENSMDQFRSQQKD